MGRRESELHGSAEATRLLRWACAAPWGAHECGACGCAICSTCWHADIGVTFRGPISAGAGGDGGARAAQLLQVSGRLCGLVTEELAAGGGVGDGQCPSGQPATTPPRGLAHGRPEGHWQGLPCGMVGRVVPVQRWSRYGGAWAWARQHRRATTPRQSLSPHPLATHCASLAQPV